MTVTNYLVGVLWLLALAAGFGATAVALRSFLLPGSSGSLARLAEAVLGIAALTVAAQILGLVGLLAPIPLLALALAGAAGSLVWRRQRPDQGKRSTGGRLRAEDGAHENALAPNEPPWATPLAVAAVAVTIMQWSGGVFDSLDTGIYRQDSTWYHLPQAATFFQTGDTWSLHFTDPMALTPWFYPMGAELPHTVGMLAFGNDFLSPFVNLAWVLLALLAAWCAGRAFGLGVPAVIAVAIALNSGMLDAQAGNAPSDVAAVFWLLAAATFLIGESRILAGLSGGMAIGTKVTMLVPAAAIAVGDLLLCDRGKRIRAAGIWAGAMLATGGYWYVRNLIHAGNPLPWLSLDPLSGPDQVDLYPRPPHSLAEYAVDFGFWTGEVFPRLAHSLGPLWPLIVVGALAGFSLAVVRGEPRVRVLGIAGIAAALAYVFIPISASGPPSNPSGFDSNLRYLAPAVALGLLLLVIGTGRRIRSELLSTALVLVFAVVVASADGWSWGQLPRGALLAALVVVAPVTLALVLKKSGSWTEVPAHRRALLAFGAASVICLAVAISYQAQHQYLDHRYHPALAPPPDNPGFRATPEWRHLQAWALKQRERRIGVVGPPGAFGQYVFFGEDLSNRVSYVGEPGPHGSYRPIGDCVSWRHEINAGDYDFVVITPASAIGPGTVPQETLWLSDVRGAQAVVSAGAGSVFRIDRALDPGGCRDAGLPRAIRVPGGGYAVPSTGPQDPVGPLPGRR